YWTPALNATGTLNAFAVVARDNSGAESATNVTAQIAVTPVNDAPTLTTLTIPVDTTNEDTEVEITFAELIASGDENDIDGTVDAFVVKSVTSGALRIGATAGTATAWAAGTNDTIDATNNAYWTPALNATGTLNAFAVVARDDSGAESAANVTAQVAVTSVNDAPTLTTLTSPVDTTNEDTEVEITFAELIASGDENDIDGTVDAFVVKSIASGTLRIGATAGTATAWAAGTNDTIDATNNAYWMPALNAIGLLDAFSVVARDNGGLESATDVVAQAQVTPVNDSVPIADTESFTVIQGGTATEADLDVGASLLDGDTDADLPFDSLTVNTTPVVGPSFGSLTLNSDGTFSYTHDGSTNVSDSFTYSVSDAVGNTATAVVTISITNVNAPPTNILPGTLSVNENTDTTSGVSLGALTATDSDTGETFTYSILPGADGLLFSIGGAGNDELILQDGVLDYESDPSYLVNVRVTDSGSNTFDKVIRVNVIDVNESPIAANDSYTVTGNTSIVASIGVLANDVDPEGDSIIVVLVTPPAHGTLSISSNGQFSYTPDEGFVGTDVFVYQIVDGISAPSQASVQLVVEQLIAVPPVVTAAAVSSSDSSPTTEATTSGDESTEAESAVVIQATADTDTASTLAPLANRAAPESPAEQQNDQADGAAGIEFERQVASQAERRAELSSPSSQSIRANLVTQTIATAYSAATEYSPIFLQAMDELRDEVHRDELLTRVMLGSSLAATTSLSVGYVIWLIRGGVLLSSVLSSLPAWQLVDPLPVLGHLDDDEDYIHDDDSLEAMVTKSNQDSEVSR
ncbi:MAG: tandem-95 repeat protein, partial [Planctomycetales bacterium]|nr:tandem-95 repeat protein [Planctomycetales bacterium]